jgi:hypothetical protein
MCFCTGTDGVVAWLVDAARYKMGGSGFDSRWGRCKVSSDLVFLSVFISLHSAYDTSEYQGIPWRLDCGRRFEMTVVPY